MTGLLLLRFLFRRYKNGILRRLRVCLIQTGAVTTIQFSLFHILFTTLDFYVLLDHTFVFRDSSVLEVGDMCLLFWKGRGIDEMGKCEICHKCLAYWRIYWPAQALM